MLATSEGLTFFLVCGCALAVFLLGPWRALRAASVRDFAPNDPGRSTTGPRGAVGEPLRNLEGAEKHRATRRRARQRERARRARA